MVEHLRCKCSPRSFEKISPFDVYMFMFFSSNGWFNTNHLNSSAISHGRRRYITKGLGGDQMDCSLDVCRFMLAVPRFTRKGFGGKPWKTHEIPRFVVGKIHEIQSSAVQFFDWPFGHSFLFVGLPFMELTYPTLEKEHKSTQVMFLGRDILVLPVTPLQCFLCGKCFRTEKAI